MPAIEARLKDLLNETRLAMLGTQLLMGLQYNAAFAQRFGSPPRCTPLVRRRRAASRPHDGRLSARHTRLSPNCGGRPGHRPHVDASVQQLKDRSAAAFARPRNRCGDWIPVDRSVMGSGARRSSIVLGAVCLWYVLPLQDALSRQREDDMQGKDQPLEVRIEQALTELRVVLPGAQALFGFQFAAVLTESFAHCPLP
jgi:hypothetical protein